MNRALAYLNVDTVVSGDHLSVSASPTLITLWKKVLGDLNKTAGHSDIRDEAPQFVNQPYGRILDANTNWEMTTTEDGEDEWKVGVLGSGSDYTVFLDHFGIPSMDFSFEKSAGQYGQYHSIYDSFAWMETFGGKDGEVGSAFDIMAFAAKLWGLLAIKMSTDEIVPLDPILQGHAMIKYAAHIEEQSKNNDDTLNVRFLTSAIEDYKKAAAKLQLQCHNGFSSLQQSNLRAREVDACNEKITMSERQFLLEEGLPGRQWFKHVLQAPGLDLGYAAEAFPGIQQALNSGNFEDAGKQIELTAHRIHAASQALSVVVSPKKPIRLL